MQTHNKPAPDGISLPEYMGLYTDGEESQIFGVYINGLDEPIRFVSYLEFPAGMPRSLPADMPFPKVWRYAMEFDTVPDREGFQLKIAETEPKFREYLKIEAERERGANGAPK